MQATRKRLKQRGRGRRWTRRTCGGAAGPVALASLLVMGPLAAQHDHTHTAGQAHDDITSIAAETVHQLTVGDGMGFALAAELNRYPGPKHVLDLGESLVLSDHQIQQVERIRAAMLRRAIEAGEQILADERRLSQLFRERTVTADSLRRLTETLGRRYGVLRALHLQAHLETAALMSREQVDAYERLRGRADGG